MTGRCLRCFLPALLWALCLPVHAGQEALREGNRLFRRGDLEAALEAYRAGYDGADPVLAYNLGTTAHHLGRLPEAVLWYRRAEEMAGNGDLWLTQNLADARQALGAAHLSPPPPWGLLEAHRHRLAWLAVGLAWLSLGLLLTARRQTSRRALRAADVSGLLAAALFTTAVASASLAPTPAVLLEPCGTAESRLAAGSEIWGRDDGEDGFRVELSDGTELTCPRAAVAEVRPPAAFFLLR